MAWMFSFLFFVSIIMFRFNLITLSPCVSPGCGFQTEHLCLPAALPAHSLRVAMLEIRHHCQHVCHTSFLLVSHRAPFPPCYWVRELRVLFLQWDRSGVHHSWQGEEPILDQTPASSQKMQTTSFSAVVLFHRHQELLLISHVSALRWFSPGSHVFVRTTTAAPRGCWNATGRRSSKRGWTAPSPGTPFSTSTSCSHWPTCCRSTTGRLCLESSPHRQTGGRGRMEIVAVWLTVHRRLYFPIGKFVLIICQTYRYTMHLHHQTFTQPLNKQYCTYIITHWKEGQVYSVLGWCERSLSAAMAVGVNLFLKQARLHLRVLYLQPDGSSGKCVWGVVQVTGHCPCEACDSYVVDLRDVWCGTVNDLGFILQVCSCWWWTACKSSGDSAAECAEWGRQKCMTEGGEQQREHRACRWHEWVTVHYSPGGRVAADQEMNDLRVTALQMVS